MLKYLENAKRFFPFTALGLIVLIISIYLVGLNKKADVIAAVIGSCGLFIIGFCFVIGLINYFLIRKNLSTSLKASRQHQDLNSQSDNLFRLEVRNVRIFPLMQIKLIIKFKESNFKPSALFLRKQQCLETTIPIRTKFPHRGFWQIEYFDYELSDIIGLLAINIRKKAENLNFKIMPKQVKYKELPLVVSSVEAGEEITSPKERHGDYYDLKKYHPSDGTKKIVWKIYARTKKLISRHPEPSASPSGEIIIYSLATKDDDSSSSRCLDYIKRAISDYDLNIKFDCSGNHNGFVHDYESAVNISLNSVWHKQSNKQIIEQIAMLCSANTSKRLSEIAVFATKETKVLREIEQFLKKQGIGVQFFFEQDLTTKRPNQIRRLFFLKDAA